MKVRKSLEPSCRTYSVRFEIKKSKKNIKNFNLKLESQFSKNHKICSYRIIFTISYPVDVKSITLHYISCWCKQDWQDIIWNFWFPRLVVTCNAICVSFLFGDIDSLSCCEHLKKWYDFPLTGSNLVLVIIYISCLLVHE